jgi:hypothetical protein
MRGYLIISVSTPNYSKHLDSRFASEIDHEDGYAIEDLENTDSCRVQYF